MKKQNFIITLNVHTNIFHLKEVEGERVKIESCPQHDFFIHRKDKVWSVSELKSGKHVASSKTRKGAIEVAEKRLSAIPREKIQKAINSAVKDRLKAVLGDLA